jgi:hypothetical protein
MRLFWDPSIQWSSLPGSLPKGRGGGRSSILKLFHVTCRINGPRDQISKEMKNHCSIWKAESILCFFSPSDTLSKKADIGPNLSRQISDIGTTLCILLYKLWYVFTIFVLNSICTQFNSRNLSGILNGDFRWDSAFLQFFVTYYPPSLPVLIIIQGVYNETPWFGDVLKIGKCFCNFRLDWGADSDEVQCDGCSIYVTFNFISICTSVHWRNIEQFCLYSKHLQSHGVSQ